MKDNLQTFIEFTVMLVFFVMLLYFEIVMYYAVTFIKYAMKLICGC